MGVELLSRAVSRGPSRVPSRGPGDGVGNIITSIFADGTDGFYFDFSKTDRLFQDGGASSPANDPDEPIMQAFDPHSWAGRSLSAQAYLSPNIAPPFVSAGTGWSTLNTDATHTVTFNNGSVHFQVDSSTPVTQLVSSSIITPGKTYRISGTVLAVVAGRLKFDAQSSSVTLPAAAGAFEFVFKAAASNSIAFYRSGAGITDVTLGDLTIQEVPGNHAYQATTAAQPKYQTGGLARFDGLDDLQSLPIGASSTAWTLAAKFKDSSPNAVSAIIGVTSAGTNQRLVLGRSGTANSLIGAWGAQSNSTITGGSLAAGTTSVGVLRGDASTVELWLNGTLVYQAAASGSPSGSAATLQLGCYAGGNFANADIYHALAIKKALTAAQIAAITNLWGTS